MTEEATPYDPGPPAADSTGDADRDGVLLAFAQACRTAPEDRTLLRAWAARYPAHAGALIAVSHAAFAAGMTLTDPLAGGPEDAETVALGRAALDAYFAPPKPLVSLITEAGTRGLTPQALARRLRLDTPTLTRLNQRLLDAATLPRALVQQMAEMLGRTTDEVTAYLRRPARLASDAQYKASQAPVLRESATGRSFGEAIAGLPAADRDFWQFKIEEGTVGDE